MISRCRGARVQQRLNALCTVNSFKLCQSVMLCLPHTSHAPYPGHYLSMAATWQQHAKLSSIYDTVSLLQDCCWGVAESLLQQDAASGPSARCQCNRLRHLARWVLSESYRSSLGQMSKLPRLSSDSTSPQLT